MNDYKVIFKDIPWERPLPGAQFKAYEQNGRCLRLVEFTDELVEPDWCHKGHIGYVLSGTMEIDFDGKTVSYQEGDGIFIPSGKNHKHIAKVRSGKVQLVLIEEA